MISTTILDWLINIFLMVAIAALLNIIVELYVYSFIEKIRTLTYGDPTFLPEFLNSFESYKDKHRKNQRVDIIFDEYEETDAKSHDFYKINIEMEYEVSFKEYTELKFIFMREFEDTSKTNYYSGKNEKIVDCQWFWAWQESLGYLNILKSSDYTIQSVYVNGIDIFNDFENIFIDNKENKKDGKNQ